MRDDHAALSLRAKRLHNEFVGKAVEAVVPDSCVPQIARQGKPAGHFRHWRVKCRVEACHLRQLRVMRGNGVDNLNLYWQMQWCKRHKALEFLEQLGTDFLRRGVARAAMHNAMSGGCGTR